MKKYILMPVLAALSLSGSVIQAQDFDNNPVVNVSNSKENLNFTIGARFMMDGAYYHSDFTPVKSGAAITDARIRTSMSYEDWYFYADFDFSKGKFSQKNIFLQYSLEGAKGYIFYNDHFFANQGVFAENKYNDQPSGYQGMSLGGRWVWRPINNDDRTFHLGAAFRYANIATGTVENNVLKTELDMGSSLETYVDATQDFLSAKLPWAKNVYDVGAEFLYKTDDFFARGEYMYKHVTKKRDDQALFEANLGSIDSWGSLESWQKGNPLGDNSFHGAYIEAGYKIFGDPYQYSNSDALLKGLNGRALEVVARYSYTGLNDLVEGEKYVPGRDQYYPNGVLADYPATSLSIGGGNMHSATLGVNYSFNKFAQVMLSYTYNRLDRDKFQYDKNFHVLQARLMFQF